MREHLIAYSLKYHGDYFKIKNAISNKEVIEPVYLENCITILDEDYPKEFFELKEKPFVLYYYGDLSLLKEEKVAIVGSRNPSDYAKMATKDLAQSLKKEVIVSGLAKGIDGIAHFNAKRTIGILGCGIDRIYPNENKELIEYCKKYQLVLSEYPKDVMPYAKHFPFRNRLIIALSKRVYVMQASFKSGTMTSINRALELNRDVYALPYRIYDDCGEVCNQLIQEGAMMISLN